MERFRPAAARGQDSGHSGVGRGRELPIIKFSVDWWNTLHQPASITKLSAPSIDPSMLTPLLLMLAGMHLFFAFVVILRMQAVLAERRIAALHIRTMAREGGA